MTGWLSHARRSRTVDAFLALLFDGITANGGR